MWVLLVFNSLYFLNIIKLNYFQYIFLFAVLLDIKQQYDKLFQSKQSDWKGIKKKYDKLFQSKSKSEWARY
jgi:hypothetical protein